MGYLYLHSGYMAQPHMLDVPDKEFRGHIRLCSWLARWDLGPEFHQNIAKNIALLRKPSIERLVDAGVWSRIDEENLRVEHFEGNKLRLAFELPRRPSTVELMAELAERDGWWCGICERPIDGDRSARFVHVDHVIPRARGGGNETENLQLAHAACNLRKGSRLQSELGALVL